MEQSGQKETLKKSVAGWKKSGLSIGFVPTMGALHEGHLDLVREAKKNCDRVVVSIFVNPLQFNNAQDLLHYPRRPEEDAKMLSAEGADFLYLPEASSFYEEPAVMNLDFGTAGKWLEGAMRPGHFSGVGVVVSRLFHLVQPDYAYFGAKDLQQVAVVKTLVRDLEFPVTIVRCPTRREPSGLAMSSRNLRLSEKGRATAARLYEALKIAMALGAEKAEEALEAGRNHLQQFPEIELEYMEWVDADSMQNRNEGKIPPEKAAICLAAKVEGIRLIDNIIWGE